MRAGLPALRQRLLRNLNTQFFVHGHGAPNPWSHQSAQPNDEAAFVIHRTESIPCVGAEFSVTWDSNSPEIAAMSSEFEVMESIDGKHDPFTLPA